MISLGLGLTSIRRRFQVMDLGSAVVAYHSFAYPSSVTVDTSLGVDTLAQWRDLSGNAHHWRCLAKANQPQYFATGISGAPYISFNAGLNQFLEQPAGKIMKFTGDFTLLFVVRSGADAQLTGNGGGQSGGDNYQVRLHGDVSPGFAELYLNAAPTAQSGNLPKSAQSWSCLTFMRTGSNARFFQNGNLLTTVSSSAANEYWLQNLGIWAGFQFNTFDLAGCVVCGRALTTPEVGLVSTVMRTDARILNV